MPSRVWTAAALALTWCGAADAQQLHCRELDPTVANDAFRAFECVSRLDAELQALRDRLAAQDAIIAELRAQANRTEMSLADIDTADPAPADLSAAVPAIGNHEGTRAVVAFTSEKGEKTCPAGWVPFEAAKDRFIMGAGASYPVVGVTGGAAEVQLDANHMPNHSHNLLAEYGWDVNGNGGRGRIDFGDGAPWGNRTGKLETDTRGGNRPFDILPPFIALYYCVKS